MRETEEQSGLREAVRAVLARHEGAAAWEPLTRQIGVAALGVPETYGGLGCGPAEVHVVMEELGRSLSPVPYLGSAVLAAQALVAAGESAEELAADRIGALAWAENGSWEPGAIRSLAAPDGGRWLLTGVKEHVLCGDSASVLLAFARMPGGRLGLFRLDGAGVRREPCGVLDRTRPQARLVLDRAPAALVGPAGAEGARILARVRDLACTALAAESVGAAARCLELTVAYAGQRVQFGRTIGSFQAVKHRLADVYTAVEAARSLALGAAHADAEPVLAAAARSACSEALSLAAAEMIQLHGGMGITWEHDAHRYFKRAHGDAHLLGTPAAHRRRIGSAVLAGLRTGDGP
ncbi:acyl-CoA/acyl-ACP dehydrogenase [Streptomyces sp. NBC_01267]|uniref:acyl-CoA dehydrogenase family protein n=1 Tax=unclassified Streptomyces TaxID=2593676 RepID=UPI002024BBCE|nr:MULTISPECIES: acyl-CoA dehydrogenase family protein [unclassified Streptomyces]MCX4552918.1 acyl-CoA/acyl-ACP dehydrogenase [Streptomyces sp. NBC_01500]